jgi:hypothetical protein
LALSGDDEESGIPQFISPDELVPPPATSKPPATPVVDTATLAQAVKDAIHFERPESFRPINFVGTLSTSLLTYQKVVEWIPDAPGGVLKEISITNDPNAQVRLVISSDEKFKDVVLQAALTVPYERMRVPGGSDKNITVYAKSTTGIAVTVQAIIDGEQIL